ncbi:MAG: ABC transporter ATP-binding protein [Candidatus Ratteibacteria bacterium]|jgi:ABC-type lipoprotein export system ATPase subunit
MNSGFIVEAKNLSKFYENGRVAALSEINLQVTNGEFLTIRGSSGSGKSTLLHLLGGLDLPTKGEIYFEDKNLKDMVRQSKFRINNIGFVFQTFYLWPILNVLENVLLPLLESDFDKKERIKKADLLINMVGLEGKRLFAVNKLSVGERQRVAIARALVMGPKLLLADEPTGSLDSKNKENVLDIFLRVNREKKTTIIMATHETGKSYQFSRSIELLDGRIIA